MSAADGADDCYERLMAVNQDLFDRGNYAAASHALAAVLHCATALGDVPMLATVEACAAAQQAGIDASEPGDRLSSASARLRNSRTAFESVGREARAFLAIIGFRGAAPGRGYPGSSRALAPRRRRHGLPPLLQPVPRGAHPLKAPGREFVERLAADPIAVEVKIADLRDNLGRIDGLDTQARAKLEPGYRTALARLIPQPGADQA